MTTEFRKILTAYRKKIDTEIEKYFEKKIKNSNEVFLKEVYCLLKEFSSRPSKRLRPTLVNVGYALAGGKNQK